MHCEGRSVGQYLLVSGTHLGPVTIYFLLLEIVQLPVCWYGAPTLDERTRQ
jgi:hypothetical protein